VLCSAWLRSATGADAAGSIPTRADDEAAQAEEEDEKEAEARARAWASAKAAYTPEKLLSELTLIKTVALGCASQS